MTISRLFLACATAGLLSCAAHADTIVFKTGQVLKAKRIVKQSDTNLTVELEFGTIEIPRAKILRIDVETPEELEAARLAEEEDKELAARMKEEGKVLRGGKWLTEDEVKKKDAEAEAKKKEREEKRAAAKKKAEEEAAKKKVEREKLLAEERQRAQQQQNEDNRRRSSHDGEGESRRNSSYNGSSSNGSSSSRNNGSRNNSRY